MKKNRIITVLFAAALLLTACEPISQLPLDYPDTTLNTQEETLETTEEAVEYTEYEAEVPEITNYDTSFLLEAEECELGGSLYISDERKGFSGEGYVTGFYGGSADYLVFKADIPSTQHYDITICAAADENTENFLTVDSLDLAPFSINGDGNFVRITIHGVFMEEGETQIRVNHGDTNFDVDYIEISNNQDVYEDSFEIESTPVTENASLEAKALLRFMQESFGEKIITGQYASGPDNKELDLIYRTTGKYPAIRFSDIGEYTKGTAPSQTEIDAAKEWDSRGGIVGFMWYWNAPLEKPSVYAKDTDFSLKSAVTDMEIWDKNIAELTELYNQGQITLECLSLIKDIDKVSEAFDQLSQDGIPVLWRPLHEAGGDWYWWGADGPEAYKWLYSLMYRRMTDYHNLDNLIWIWNGQSEEYLVSSDEYDIAALDIYLSPNTVYGSRSEQFRWLRSITDGEKLLAIGECSTIPGIDEMCRDNSLWSFFGLWFGEYIEDKNGELSEVYNTKENLIKVYNAQNSVTLDSYAGTYGVG
ncbi:MAG: glycosyl hydrolase [Porcipelethomonas sp.]